MQKWIEEEFGTSDFGDIRLDKRCILLADRLSLKPSESIPAACGTWKNTIGAYRFFDNDKVTEKEILRVHRDAVLKRIREHKTVLLIQDTTEIDITRPTEQVQDSGPLNDSSRIGFLNHVMLAVTPDGIPLGVADTEIWNRDPEEFGNNKNKSKGSKEKAKKQKPIEEKESFRWLQFFRKACEVQTLSPATKIICISDSEGDIYECFAEGNREDQSGKADWIVRACQNRSLEGPPEEKKVYRKLWDEAGSAKVSGLLEIKVSKNEPSSGGNRKRKQGRSARKCTAEVRAKKVKLKAPYRKGTRLPNTEVNAVLIRETDPPSDEQAVEWLLLTGLPIDSAEAVETVIHCYCCRWQIEIYFRVLKSGCRVEKRQLETAERYKPCLMLYMIIAWWVMYVMMSGRKCPDMPCDRILSEEEWKSVYVIVKHREPPLQIPTLQEMVGMIARLGGYLGRKNDGPPGPKAMWIGMQRMTDFALAWKAFRPPPENET